MSVVTLSITLKQSERPLSCLVSPIISPFRNVDTEANESYGRAHRLYDIALLTRCYTQHALRPYIDSEINHIRHFIKIHFVNQRIEFINKKGSEYDQEIPQSHIADQPTAP